MDPARVGSCTGSRVPAVKVIFRWGHEKMPTVKPGAHGGAAFAAFDEGPLKALSMRVAGALHVCIESEEGKQPWSLESRQVSHQRARNRAGLSRVPCSRCFGTAPSHGAGPQSHCRPRKQLHAERGQFSHVTVFPVKNNLADPTTPRGQHARTVLERNLLQIHGRSSKMMSQIPAVIGGHRRRRRSNTLLSKSKLSVRNE